MRALPSGVEVIDHVLGGFTPGLPCVLSGPSGSGRTVLAIQLAQAALEAGRVVSLLCNEPAPFLLRQAESLGVDLTPWLRSGQLALLEMDAEIGSTTTALGTEALIESIRAEQPQCTMLIVDPATVLTTGMFDEAQLRASARDLVRATQTWSVVLTVESERLALQQGLEKILGEICGSFLELSREADGTRSLEVVKTRAGVASATTAHFTIGADGAQLLAPDAVDGRRGDEVAALDPGRPSSDAAPAAGREADPAETQPDVGAQRDAGALGAPLRDPDARPRILVVDDDGGSRQELRKWLETRYDVETAHDGFEAMSAVLAHRPDLVILDLVMPRVTGYELLAAFQRGLEDVPRLVLSSRFERPADRLSPLVLGATDLLAKPVERFELLHKVDLLLRLSAPPDQIMDPHEAQALFATPGKSRVMDARPFHERLERAHRFGDRFDITSSLVAVRADDSTTIDAVLEAADADLRFEDAALRVSARRAVVLLVATPQDDAAHVFDRVLARLPEPSLAKIHFQIHRTHGIENDFRWHSLFRDEVRGDDEGGDAS